MKPAEYIKKLVALGIDPKPFETERTWYRKGTRGLLHGSLTCWKAPSKYSATEAKISTLKIGKNTCNECFEKGLDTDQAVYTHGKNYLEIHKSLQMLQREQENNDNATLAMSQINEINRIEKRLLSLEKRATSHHEPLAANLQKLIDTYKKVLQSKSEGAQEEILRTIANDILSRNELYQGSEVDQLGYFKSHSVANLLSITWKKTWAKTNSYPETRIATIQDLLQVAKLEATYQLKEIPLTPILDGEDLGKYNERVWKEYIQAKTSEILTRWETIMDNILKDQSMKLVVLKKISSESVTGIFSALISAYKVAENAHQTEYALVVPAPVAVWLQQRVGAYDYETSVGGYQARIEYTSSEIPSPSEIETALSLWDLTQSGPHSTFENSLATAKRI